MGLDLSGTTAFQQRTQLHFSREQDPRLQEFLEEDILMSLAGNELTLSLVGVSR